MEGIAVARLVLFDKDVLVELFKSSWLIGKAFLLEPLKNPFLLVLVAIGCKSLYLCKELIVDFVLSDL